MSAQSISILFAGDLVPSVEETERENAGTLAGIKRYIDEADLSVCHLGLTTGKKTVITPTFAKTIAEAGFRVIAVADNHTYALDHTNLLQSKPVFEEAGLRVAGVQSNAEDKPYTMSIVQGIRVAVINFGYAPPGKWLPRKVDESAKLVNFFRYKTLEDDLASIQKAMDDARAEDADVVILYLHWGDECEEYSSVSEKYVAYRCAQMGADAIICSHCQILQEMETLTVTVQEKEKSVPVFYGLGSIYLGAADGHTDAVLAKLDIRLEDRTVSADYIPVPASDHENDQACQRIGMILGDQIRPTPVVPHFQEFLRLKIGQRKSLSMDNYTDFRSEDAIVASALQNGVILGNSDGYTAITATDPNGTVHGMMVCVSGVLESGIPVLVNENNAIRGYYPPVHLVKGAEFKLPDNINLSRSAAEGWMAMKASALADGVVLSVRSGHRNRRQQRIRVQSFGNMYPQPGKSEHHLGLALHIQGGECDGKVTTAKEAKDWVWKHAHQFGFLSRKPQEKQGYIHLRFLERPGEARYLHNNDLTLEKYLQEYEKHKKRRLAGEKQGIEIPIDGVAVIQSLVPGGTLRSKNAYVASVLQTGKVIGNAPGKTEILIEVGQRVIRTIPCVVQPKIPLLLNRYNGVSAPAGKLVRLPDEHSAFGKTIYLEEKTKTAFEIMCAVARAQGIWLYAKQGYRSKEDQEAIIQYYIEKDGAEAAAQRCAPAGYSEHHSGLAIDVNGGILRDGAVVQDKKTALSWVRDHCHEFGFFVKNLPGKEHITGTMAEPWHIRYLGDMEICRVLHERQITLDEYLEEII